MKKKIVIIGAGPAGLFSAYKLSETNKFDIIILDRGRDVDSRKCPLEYTGECDNCNPMQCVIWNWWLRLPFRWDTKSKT